MNLSYIPSGGRQNLALTAREHRVIALVGAGYTNKDLAQKLGISVSTAKRRLTNLFGKLGVMNRLELVLLALHKGLLGRSRWLDNGWKSPQPQGNRSTTESPSWKRPPLLDIARAANLQNRSDNADSVIDALRLLPGGAGN